MFEPLAGRGSLVLVCCLAQLPAQEVRTYAIRVADKIVGYQVETETPRQQAGREVVEFTVRSLLKVEVLGSSFDQKVDQTWTLAADTRAVLRVRSQLEAGTARVRVHGELGEHGFTFAEEREGALPQVMDPATVVVAPDYRWLWQRGPQQPGPAVELQWFTPEFGNVSKMRVALVAAARDVDVLGRTESARFWSIELPDHGNTFHVGVTADGRTVRYEVPAAGMVVEPAAPALVERLQRVDLTHTIVGKTNLDLDDPTPLTFVKVKVVADATKDVSVAGLQAPGQTFVGTVVDGRIDGVFEIRTGRSDGKGAPAFPVPAGTFAAAALQPFLQAEPGIQSDDAAIVAKARELAAGATDCFQVVQRLADWAHAEIGYAIPGGVTAAGTMAAKAGDCGGHSHLLAAMLRSLGIPARTPMGAMYVPLYGGSFGQHMWNEVWLGDAIGWLPVDCTVGQSTFVDASHIRLAGGVTAFRPQSIEVLDWAPRVTVAAAARRQDAWPWQVGDTVTWTWRRNGQDLGVETMTYERAGDGGHLFVSRVDLAKGRFIETMRTEVGDDGRARSLQAQRDIGEARSTFGVQVTGNSATVTSKVGDEERSEVVEMAADTLLLHNNSVGHFAILAARLPPLAEGAEVRVQVLSDESRSAFGMQVRGGAEVSIELGGVATRAQVLAMKLAGAEFEAVVDPQGRLLRWRQPAGGIEVVLQR